jgi:hypothetical protein
MRIDEKIDIINSRINMLQEIYDANEKDIEQINIEGCEPDYGLDECYSIKQNLISKINALNIEKQILTNSQ